MAGPESIAVDPSVITARTQIYVQGVGLRTADDTGGAITGDHVDIWEPTYYACAIGGAKSGPFTGSPVTPSRNGTALAAGPGPRVMAMVGAWRVTRHSS